MNIYSYQLEFYNEGEGKDSIEQGFVCGENYSDAMGKLAFFYGDRDINEIKKLKIVTDNPLFVIEDMSLFVKVENAIVEDMVW